MRVIFIGSIMLALSLGAGAQHKDNFGPDLRNALSAYDNAWNKKDVAGVSAVLADGYVYFSSTGELLDRKRTLEFLASPDYRLTFAERTEIVLQSMAGDTAVVSSRWRGRGMYGKTEINDDQRCGLVFVRAGKKQWKLIAENCVQIAAR